MSTVADRLLELAQRQTHHRQRAEAMGFTFDTIRLVENDPGILTMRVEFKCVCGTPEELCMAATYHELAHVNLEYHRMADPAKELHLMGSFSREHLLADGFPAEEVERIIQKGEDFDRYGPGYQRTYASLKQKIKTDLFKPVSLDPPGSKPRELADGDLRILLSRPVATLEPDWPDLCSFSIVSTPDCTLCPSESKDVDTTTPTRHG